jgi:hypothetical protein
MMSTPRMTREMIPTTRYLSRGANDTASISQSVAKALEERKRMFIMRTRTEKIRGVTAHNGRVPLFAHLAKGAVFDVALRDA